MSNHSAAVFSLPRFKNELLWQQAMTHRSFVNEGSAAAEHDRHSDNERLEFLGDAILTFLSGDYLYQRFPAKTEGDLTPIRAFLVDQPQLCHFAKALSLDNHLKLGKGAEKEGGRKSTRLLCSAFEAMIGAYYLDSHRDVEAVRQYVTPMFESVIGSAEQAGVKDDKTKLQEWAQQKGEMVEYVTVGSSGPDHHKRFVVEVRVGYHTYGTGDGRSKQKAQKAAAKAALRLIQKNELE
ncbi:MAG: ribonuclease III [Cyanobacteria bacterium J06560_6]